jgi:glycogen(starch) synthase
MDNTSIDPQAMTVVYNGIDTTRFIPPATNHQPHTGLKLLYAGSLVWHKGVHTALEAMGILARRGKLGRTTLTLVGSGHPTYEAHLHQMVERNNLQAAVHFRGRVSRDQMPELLQEFDGLIFPSTWEEPLARITQEAMATGLVVIGTTTGGTKEILIEGETGFTFLPEDAEGLADKIEYLICQPQIVEQVSRKAREVVERQFDIRRMVDQVEAHLSQAIQISRIG